MYPGVNAYRVSIGLVPYYSREAKQLGADLQTRSLGGCLIDLEPQLAAHNYEIDDSSPLGEAFGFSDGKGTGTGRSQGLPDPVPFRRSHKDHMAVGQCLRARETLHNQTPSVSGLAIDHLLDQDAGSVIADHTDDQRGTVIGKCLRRPFDELYKIEQKGRFGLVLVEYAGLTISGNHARRNNQSNRNSS